MWAPLLGIVLSYLLGSIPAAAWLARTRGIDIRQVGSGNSGATNVLRSLGKGPALLVALFDIGKGALAVWLGKMLGLSPEWTTACAIAAVLGHNFSIFLGFRGGKGVATSFGTLTVLEPATGIGAFVIAIACMWLTRYVSAGSIMGAVSATVLVLVLHRSWFITAAILFLAALLVWQHRSNVQKLRNGTERKLGERSAA